MATLTQIILGAALRYISYFDMLVVQGQYGSGPCDIVGAS